MKEFIYFHLIIIALHINFLWVDGNRRAVRHSLTLDGNSNVTNKKIQETFKLLNQGENLIELYDKSRESILVLGNTGAGKSTFTQWIAGDDTKLISVKDPKTVGGFIIHDNNTKIGNSTITSKTIFPELWVDSETDTAFYDFPGFHDTRGVANDIATTYFIKKVVDHTRSIKLIFVINYHSVTSMGTRQDFTDLIRHATDLVKDFDKFRNSIGIVASKVKNDIDVEASSAEGKLVYFEDKSVIESIASFIEGVKQELKNDIATKTGLSEKVKTYYKNAIKCIETLLIKNGDDYSRIGIFRVPNSIGPLSNITLLQKGKEHIKTILYKNLKFTTKSLDDFGYTIPNESKNDISEIIEAINRNIWYELSNITTLVDNHYHDLIRQIYVNITSFVTSIDPVDAHPEEAHALAFKINNGHNITTHLIKYIKDLTNPEQLAGKINDSYFNSGIVIPGAIILNLSNQGRYLKFLEIFSNKIRPINQWVSLFQRIVTYLEDSMKNVQDKVKDIAERINGTIKIGTESTAKIVKNHYEERFKIFRVQELSAELHKGSTVMLETMNKIGNSLTIDELINIIRRGMDILGITFPKQTFLSLKYQGRYLEYLQELSETELYLGILALKNPFEDLLENLHKSEKWYTFLDGLYEKLSSYEIQSERSKYDVANIEDWGKEGKPAGIWITQDSFNIFIQKITEYDISGLNEMKNFKASDLQLGALNQVLSSTLKYGLNKLCPTPDKLVITGDFIKLSDISMNECSETIKYIEIFAFNKFFVDTNFIQIGRKIQLSVISPTWHTVDHYKIILDGSPGKEPDPKSAITTNAAPGGKGADGKPGLPGGPGGNFFGIGHTFINSEWLYVSINGGRGGNGQDGGSGMEGVSGKKPNVPETTGSNSGWVQAGFKVILVNRKTECFGNGFAVTCKFADYGLWSVYGTNCSDGGSGGDGGHGGYGGNPGKIIVITLAGTSLSIENKTGETGSNGVGGNGAKPGVSGGHLKILEEHPIVYISHATYTIVSRTDFPSCVAGVTGISGLNRNNLNEPDQTKILHPSFIVNDYKKYARENLRSSLRKSSISNFLKHLKDSQSVRDLYDVSGFLNELNSLESHYHNLHNKISFLSFYQSLLNRVDHYIARKSLNYHKVLDYLRIAVYSKINSIQNDSENYLVVDIKRYFPLVEKHIEQYKKTLKEIKIDTYRTQYKDSINRQITEANTVIEQNILPAIDDIYSHIDNQISLLIQHITSQQNISEKKLKEALQVQDKLTRELPLMAFLGTIKFTSQFLAFAGPMGTAASGLIGVTAELLSPEANTKAALSTADKSLQQIITYYKSEQTFLKLNLDLAKQKLSKDLIDKANEDLKNVQNEIEIVKTNLDRDVSPDTLLEMKERLKDFAKREEELAEEIESKAPGEKEILEHESAKRQKKIEVKVQIASHVRTAVTLAEIGLDSSKRYKELQILMSKAGDKVTKISEEIDALKRYENNIYHTMVPVRKNLEEGLKEMGKQSSKASSVGLDISKWQIQSTVKEFQMKMQDMLQASNNATIQSKFMECVDKLQGSMFTMIQVYDRIQDYQGKTRLANYIADLSSKEKITTNQELSAEIDQLELLTQSNLILQEYEKASSAFKQYIFPFASLYLDKFDLSPHVNQSKNISDLVFHARKQVEFLTDELTKSASVIRNTPYRIFPDIKFHTENIENPPFVIWKHDSKKYEISKLLQGQKIILNADITRGVKLNAIKFNEIGIRFKTANKTIQGELDQQLLHYLVGMSHLGNSHYRCDDKYYIITHNRIDMKHSVSIDKQGHFYQLDDTSTIIRNNNPLFSPYTQWEIQLYKKDADGHDFEDLKKYANQEIDLTLEGHGQYVELGIDICEDNNLKKYYNVYSYV